MKDRFKFRFWYKPLKLMIYSEKNIEFTDYINNDNYIPMQCTGLKDDNKKLIYEGDIVRYAETRLDEVTQWETAEVVWGGNYDYPAFDLKDKDFDGINALSYLFSEGWIIEVVDNIYQNQELLDN